MKLSRRALLGTGASLSVTGAGCLTVGWGGASVDIEVTNNDSHLYDTRITVSGDFAETTDTKTIDAGETVVFAEIVPKLDYDHEFTVELSLDGEVLLDNRYRMDHGLDTYAFRITEDGTITSEEFGY